jgi:hypothetical protein
MFAVVALQASSTASSRPSAIAAFNLFRFIVNSPRAEF